MDRDRAVAVVLALFAFALLLLFMCVKELMLDTKSCEDEKFIEEVNSEDNAVGAIEPPKAPPPPPITIPPKGGDDITERARLGATLP
jgi:hypothetical protein